MTCKGKPGYVTEMAPALNVPRGTHPPFLPDIADRPIDIAFSGCDPRARFSHNRLHMMRRALLWL